MLYIAKDQDPNTFLKTESEKHEDNEDENDDSSNNSSLSS